MAQPKQFGRLLTEGIHRIRLRENISVQIVQDELGYQLNRDGGSAIRYWRAGHIPAYAEDVELLAREIVKRGDLNEKWLRQFLKSGDYPAVDDLCAELFPNRQTAVAATPSAQTKLSPFVIGPPVTHPRQFFGREAELSRIFDVLAGYPLQNVAIVGAYRSGKTSLLHYLSQITTAVPAQLRPQQKQNWLPQPFNTKWVFVDFQDPRMGRQERLLGYILESLNLPVPTPCDLINFMDVMSDHVQQPTIILLDEIGAALAAPELDMQFWWSLRALSSTQTNGNLAFVLTAHNAPADLAQSEGKPSPFFNIFGHTLHLQPLSETAALELIQSAPISFAEADVAWILQESGRWPCLLQILCHARLAALKEKRSDDDWRGEALLRLRPYQHLLARENGD